MSKRGQKGKQEKQRKICSYCGTKHDKGKCPAYNTKCTNCSKWHHFASVCRSGSNEPQKEDRRPQKSSRGHQRSKQSHHIAEEEEEPDDSDLDSDTYSETYLVKKSVKSKYIVLPEVKMPYQTSYTELPIQIDNGSEVNCMRKQDLCRIDPHAKIERTHTKLKAYGDSTLIPLGKAEVDVKINGKEKRAEFIVIEEASGSLLSGQLSEELGLISVKRELLVNQVNRKPVSKEEITKEYRDVFHGLGRIGEYRIELKENAKPTQDAPRTVPVALRSELKERLKEMESDGILEKVTEPTDWVNSAVYVKRPNKKLRVCLDPRRLNQSVRIPKYRMPTLEDITPELSKVRIFSVCDAKDGFLQIELDQESSLLTTFHTPFGRYCWKRMPFGICSAPEEFQRRVLEIIEDLTGVYAIADDCLIVGQGDTMEEATADHDKNFTAFLEKCRESNLKLNLSKLKFRLTSVKYHGHILSSEGLSPDPEKVEAIQGMPRPKDKAETRRLLGMITYLSKFIPQLSEVTQPLREITKQDHQFLWSSQHEKSLDKVKDLICKSPCLKYFDVNEECTLETDASEYGLGAILTQHGRPVAYASRTLTETERRYSQQEKECLSLVFGCQRFDQYLFGNEKVTAFTDHQSLQTILRKPINTAPKRIQRMMLRLQRYKLNVIYKKGSTMYVSDHLSRSPLEKSKSNKSDWEIFTVQAEEQFTREVEETTTDLYHNVGDVTLKQVKKATSADPTLQKLANSIARGFPTDKSLLEPELKNYWPYRDELSVEDGAIYRGVRVLIPAALRPDMLKKIHSSHLGVEATIRKARDSIYWPSIHNDITSICLHCQTCQAHQPSNSKEPMKSQPIPQRRWQICSTDLFTLKTTDYLIVVDNLTKYWEVEQLPNTTANEIVQKTKAIFARQGIPELLISDNGAQYTSKEYKVFKNEWGFEHYTSSPHHSQGNGTAEAAVKVVKRMFKKADDPYLAILEHRCTPDATGYTSSQKLNSRKIRSTVPIKPSELEPKTVPTQEIIKSQILSKQRNKEQYDRHAKPLPSLQVGDCIRARLHPKSQKEWTPATVTEEHGGSYTIKAGSNEYRRNRVHCRKSTQLAPISEEAPMMQIPDSTETNQPPVPAEPEAPKEVPPPTRETPKPSTQSPSSSVSAKSVKSPKTTRSGRPVKKPRYLDDFVDNK